MIMRIVCGVCSTHCEDCTGWRHVLCSRCYNSPSFSCSILVTFSSFCFCIYIIFHTQTVPHFSDMVSQSSCTDCYQPSPCLLLCRFITTYAGAGASLRDHMLAWLACMAQCPLYQISPKVDRPVRSECHHVDRTQRTPVSTRILVTVTFSRPVWWRHAVSWWLWTQRTGKWPGTPCGGADDSETGGAFAWPKRPW